MNNIFQKKNLLFKEKNKKNLIEKINDNGQKYFY